MTIHDNIDEFLAADFHSELSDEELNALHAHLVECADCRQAHQETKIMNKVLEEKFDDEKPDVAFENRMLAHFRNRAPNRRGTIATFVLGLMRLRSAQITAVAAVLIALVQVGRMVTGEEGRSLQDGKNLIRDELAQRTASVPAGLAKFNLKAKVARESDAVASGGRNAAAPAPPSEPRVIPKFHEEKPASEQEAVGGVSHLFEIPAKSAESAEQTITGGTPNAKKTEENVVDTYRRGDSESATAPTSSPAQVNRKLIRNATVDLEIVSFDEAVQKITALVNEEKGYVATTSSEKQENGKLKGEIVVKVLPENLDRFLQKIRGLGELKNQTLGTEDITKNYFDTESRLKNARVMEQRLIDMLKKKSDDINDLLQVEKELGRVREEIEKMQGDLKFWDSEVQFATVTISLAEKDLEAAAKYLLKERATLALYTPEVEKVYNDLKALASAKVQITNARLDRDNTGRVSARVSMLIAPEESDGVVAKAKAMGRVENFQVQTERVAQGGEGMSENANTKRDKVSLNITISRDEQEQAFQQTSLRIRTAAVDEKTKELRELAEKQNGRVRNSSFSRDPEGREYANVALRVPMKNYNALMQSLGSLGKVEDVSVQRQDRSGGQVDEANAPADLSIQVYSQGNIVSSDTGIIATLRRTIGQSAAAIMWSLRMIGVAIAFLAPWITAIVVAIWIVRRIRKR
jgi:hypothetical protein